MARKTDSNTTGKGTTDYRSDNAETVVFLGQALSRAEYDIACRNLRAFFDLLKSWQEGDIDEPSEL